MTKVTYRSGQLDILSSMDNAMFLLKNIHGDYVSFGNPNTSNYNGYLIRQADTYLKILSGIVPSASLSNSFTSIDPFRFEELVLDGKSAKRRYSCAGKEMTQNIFMLEQGLIVELDGRFDVILDCKRLFDGSDSGRIYSVTQEMIGESALCHDNPASLISIHYSKFNDGSQSRKEYEVFVAIITDVSTGLENEASIVRKDLWEKVNYSYDDYRGTKSTPWVYNLMTLNGRGNFAIAASDSYDLARKEAISLFARKESLLREHSYSHDSQSLALPIKEQLAYRALDTLCLRRGIFAGLPWFFQEWSRDEIISYGGLLAAKRYTQLIEMMNKWYGVIHEDGTLPAMYPDKGLASSDASGWLGKRTRDLLVELADHDLSYLLSYELLCKWRDGTGKIIDQCASRIRNGLVYSAYNTTWMDTSHNDNGREGFCIEIQALFLALCDAHAHLCVMTKTPVSQKRSELAREVFHETHSRFFKDGTLYDMIYNDGSIDSTLRPNAFIAWYVAPNLFTKDEWKSAFSRLLPELWLPWGGLSSIGVHDKNFHPYYTGEDVASYHRGDSWYFVNNMAALALHAIDPDGYSNEVRQITDASMRDLLEQGFAGCSSEISSANSQIAGGCYAQAWSASTLLELLLKLESAR